MTLNILGGKFKRVYVIDFPSWRVLRTDCFVRITKITILLMRLEPYLIRISRADEKLPIEHIFYSVP